MIDHFNKENWSKMTMFEQMGNIGSEVGRACNAKKVGDSESMQAAMYRGVDLMDYTAELWAHVNTGRTRELLRAKEVFVASILSENVDTDIENYFFQYAMAARRDR
jgi:hypothetical protein